LLVFKQDQRIIVIEPDRYTDRIKDLVLRMAEDFSLDITVEINVDRVNKIAKIRVVLHNF
jgi:hypothetical protein